MDLYSYLSGFITIPVIYGFVKFISKIFVKFSLGHVNKVSHNNFLLGYDMIDQLNYLDNLRLEIIDDITHDLKIIYELKDKQENINYYFFKRIKPKFDIWESKVSSLRQINSYGLFKDEEINSINIINLLTSDERSFIASDYQHPDKIVEKSYINCLTSIRHKLYMENGKPFNDIKKSLFEKFVYTKIDKQVDHIPMFRKIFKRN